MPRARTTRLTRLAAGLLAAAIASGAGGATSAAAEPITDLATATLATATTAATTAAATATTTAATTTTATARPGAVPVVLTGAQLPQWSRLAATGTAAPTNPVDDVRDAHNGNLVVPPDARPGAPVEDIVAFSYDAAAATWTEIPVQVDERFPYFLANFRSGFGMYSQTDMELTYEWQNERWRHTAGECEAHATEPATQDPVLTLDDDDEIVFMPSDAGDRAPAATYGPPDTAGTRQEVAIADPSIDPADATTPAATFVYLFTRPAGPAFDATNGYVDYERDANADEYIDRGSFPVPGDPEVLSASNTGYGPNLPGTVCDTDPITQERIIRNSNDRFPRDGTTVETDAYRWRASGRWMIRGMQVAKPAPAAPRTYGPDLVDRWKGRAFQQSPDSTVSVVGFEDEQVNWEANSALLGDLAGPVRAIRETWGADSGTNVTKTETFYRDGIVYRYHLRVHPIPPDGLYTSWDYNAGVAKRYYTPVKPAGVVIDGLNDDVGNVDAIGNFPAFFDAPDPTLNIPATILTWEQVSGKGNAGSLVYVLENKGPTSFTEPAVVPYYRDDKCLDDGTGDNPVPRPWPGESSTDSRVRDAYTAMAGRTSYDDVTCDERQGAWGSHGVHFFVTGDTDNAFVNAPVPVNEVDAQQWQFAVPTAVPTNVGDRYHLEVRAPLVAAATEQANVATKPTVTTYTGATSTQSTDSLTLAGRVTDEHGTPLAGETLVFSIGSYSAAATTDADGVGSTTIARFEGPAGLYNATVRFNGADEVLGSMDDATVTVARDATLLKVSAANGIVTAHLRATDDAQPVAGRTVTIKIADRPATTHTTDANGLVSVAKVYAPGERTTARFAGDGSFLGASGALTAQG